MKNKKIYFVFLICITLFTVGQVHKTFENDTFFTIPIGNYILEHGIDNAEPLSMHEELKFVKLRWAFDITVSIIYNSFGFTGLYIFTVIMAIVFSASLYIVMHKMSRHHIAPLCFTVLVTFFCSNYLVCRAQIVSYTIFVWEVYFLYKLAKDGNKKYSIALVLLSMLLLAFHSSVWIIYLVLFLPFIVEYIISFVNIKKRILPKKVVSEEIKIKELSITFGVVFLTGFCTPLGLSSFTYAFKSFGSIANKFITELQPLEFFQTPQIYVSLLVLICITFFSKTKVRMANIFYIIGCLIMALIAERNLYIALPIIAIAFNNIIKDLLQDYKMEEGVSYAEKYFNDKAFMHLFLIITFSGYLVMRYSTIKDEQMINESFFPVDAVNYIKENLDYKNIRLYNDFDYGSYIEFQGIKAFIDSRSEIYCKEFNNVNILEDWYKVYYQVGDKMTLEKLIQKYNLTHVLLMNESEYVEKLRENKMYEEIYNDENFVLFEKIY